MTQYLLLIHGNAKTKLSAQEWDRFFATAQQSGFFQGGSAIGERVVLGDAQSAKSSDHLVGYMRFDSDDRSQLLDLLKRHPIVLHGGSVELCELAES